MKNKTFLGADPDVVFKWFSAAIKPDPLLTVSEWSDKNRILSKRAASEPGPWRTERTPYLKEVMDCLSVFHPAKKIIFKKSAQVGATEAGNNWIGYIIANAPGPCMLVLPTVDLARRNSKLRIDPLIEESPVLKQRVSTPRAKQSSNTINQKDFDGGTLIITGANSAAGLRSMPAKFTMMDEIDAYSSDVEGEGSPIELVMARSRTFARRKAFLVSTPTLEGFSKIDDEYENSDRREYFVPCPHCSGFQTLKFDMLKWPEENPGDAEYYCEHCGEAIPERHKTDLLNKGEWRAQNPGHENAGFFINSLYSPLGWYSWGDMAKDYTKARKEYEEQKKDEKLRTFTNTALGLSYKEPGEAPEWQRLFERRESYDMATVPVDDIYKITCGVDVQKDRIEAEVVAWGPNKESWSIEYSVFPGNTATDEVWLDLEKFLKREYVDPSGKKHSISATAIDSGYESQRVYNFCRRFRNDKVFAVKGQDHLTVQVGAPRVADVKLKGKIVKRRAVKIWPLGVSILKGELYSWLKLDTPETGEYPTGFCHFPEYAAEYFKQLTAEKVVTRRNRKGYTVQEWVKDRDRNEALDCRVYARAAAPLLGLDRLRGDEAKRSASVNTPAKETIVRTEDDVQTVLEPKRSRKILRRKNGGDSLWG